MITFLKINVISMLYALVIFIPLELFVNVSRITRLTGGQFNHVAIVLGIAAIISIILLSILIFIVTKKWMNDSKLTFLSVLLWFPYLILFVWIFASLFPINHPADQGGPGDGFIVLGLLFIYPFFVLLLNLFSTFSSDVESE